jgi:hypothetical protein
MVWEKEFKPHLFVRFRFEGNDGASKTLRKADGSKPFVVRSADTDEEIRELDRYVLAVEEKLGRKNAYSQRKRSLLCLP